MLEIVPVSNKEFRRHICSDLKTDFIPDSLAYCAKSDGNVLALCQFKISGDSADILSFGAAENDMHVHGHTARILILAVLNYLDACEVKAVLYHADGTFIKDLKGFRALENGSYYTEINGFFPKKSRNEAD